MPFTSGTGNLNELGWFSPKPDPEMRICTLVASLGGDLRKHQHGVGKAKSGTVLESIKGTYWQVTSMNNKNLISLEDIGRQCCLCPRVIPPEQVELEGIYPSTAIILG